jgi:hypothetical protein
MKIKARISFVTAQYIDNDALVFPVDAHAARFAPSIRA